jgi:transcriptional regulator with XRE-family HTH domain
MIVQEKVSERRRISAARLAEARKNLGYTQEDLARATGFDRRSIGRWESPRGREPSPRCLRVLSEVLGEPISWLRAYDLEEH